MYFLCLPVRSGHSGTTTIAINFFCQAGDTFPFAGDIFLICICIPLVGRIDFRWLSPQDMALPPGC
jgi:hypothetical protein